MNLTRRRTPEIDPEAADLELAAMCKALAHPARLRIIRLLLGTDGCLTRDLVDELGLAQSTVSQHVKTLRDAELIIGTADGQSTCLCVRPERMVRLVELIAELGRR
jgi:ArsR family transcriptional regulator